MCCPGELADLEWTLAGGKLVPAALAEPTSRLSLDTLAGTEWVLRAWDVGEPADVDVTLEYRQGAFAGRSGCNRYRAPAAAGEAPGAVIVSPLAVVTRMACPEPQSAVEARFLEQLRDAKAFGFLLGQLALTYERDGRWGTMLFEGRPRSTVDPG